jgi:MYXO-CTERM domain-containing protein
MIGPWHQTFTVANIACNFCGLKEIRFPAISLPVGKDLCSSHGVPGPGTQQLMLAIGLLALAAGRRRLAR